MVSSIVSFPSEIVNTFKSSRLCAANVSEDITKVSLADVIFASQVISIGVPMIPSILPNSGIYTTSYTARLTLAFGEPSRLISSMVSDTEVIPLPKAFLYTFCVTVIELSRTPEVNVKAFKGSVPLFISSPSSIPSPSVSCSSGSVKYTFNSAPSVNPSASVSWSLGSVPA
ncbi:MAG: hypothetical protein BWY74_03210 [Firmicutes bacterium ADurb.Bin419]|nr:MAG: hypothetical protein BWY74_03210 [Firmicutes bacterium ADurb.Bin419]